MKKILLFACSLVLGMSAMAQTDVTSTYLVNPSFELKAAGTAATAEGLTNNGTYYGWQLPNLGASYVNISIGNSTACAGQAFGIPTAKEGETYYYCRRGWNSSTTADATLSTTAAVMPSGSYKLTVSYKGLDSYDKDHSSKGSNLTVKAVMGEDVLATVKSANFEAVNGNSAGAGKFTGDANWNELTLSFDVTETGPVSFQFVHHFVGGVRTDVVLDNLVLVEVPALDNAKDAAKAALPMATVEMFGLTQAQIDAYISQIDAATSESQVNAIVAAALAAAKAAPAYSGDWNILNTTAAKYMATNGAGVVFSADPVVANFEWAATGAYIKIADKYINMAGNNAWSMSADAEAKTAWTFALSDGKYTIAGPNGLIGADGTADGATLYGNKNAGQNGLWTINVALTESEIALAKAKNELQAAINAVTVPTANIGVTFGYKQDVIEKVAGDVESAQNLLDNSSDIDAISAMTETLAADKTALAAEDAFIAPDPLEGAKYAFVLTYDGWNYDNKAITYMANKREDHGKYNIQYNSEYNPNYAQSFTMTQVDGGYKMSQIDAEGLERYISTGVVYGGNASQIRTTLDAEQALVVKVIPTAAEGKFNLWNTEANQYIGSQDDGVFTVNSHIDFNIITAYPGKGDYIDILAQNQYATICSPHAIHLMTDAITAVYTVDGVEENGTTLTLTALTLEDNTIPANTPVLLYAENGASNQHAGWGTSYKGMSLTKGLLTGVYEYTPAPVGSYVLQNHDGVVGFYQVTNEGDANISEYKCYLTAPSSARVLAFGEETAISAIDALTSGKAQIFDLNGRKLNSLQKGINIVNGVKILVK